jgi:hypothetical protein
MPELLWLKMQRLLRHAPNVSTDAKQNTKVNQQAYRTRGNSYKTFCTSVKNKLSSTLCSFSFHLIHMQVLMNEHVYFAINGRRTDRHNKKYESTKAQTKQNLQININAVVIPFVSPSSLKKERSRKRHRREKKREWRRHTLKDFAAPHLS